MIRMGSELSRAISANQIRDRFAQTRWIDRKRAGEVHEQEALNGGTDGKGAALVAFVWCEKVREHPLVHRHDRPQIFVVGRRNNQFKYGRRLDSALHDKAHRVLCADVWHIIGMSGCCVNQFGQFQPDA